MGSMNVLGVLSTASRHGDIIETIARVALDPELHAQLEGPMSTDARTDARAQHGIDCGFENPDAVL